MPNQCDGPTIPRLDPPPDVVRQLTTGAITVAAYITDLDGRDHLVTDQMEGHELRLPAYRIDGTMVEDALVVHVGGLGSGDFLCLTNVGEPLTWGLNFDWEGKTTSFPITRVVMFCRSGMMPCSDWFARHAYRQEVYEGGVTRWELVRLSDRPSPHRGQWNNNPEGSELYKSEEYVVLGGGERMWWNLVRSDGGAPFPSPSVAALEAAMRIVDYQTDHLVRFKRAIEGLRLYGFDGTSWDGGSAASYRDFMWTCREDQWLSIVGGDHQVEGPYQGGMPKWGEGQGSGHYNATAWGLVYSMPQVWQARIDANPKQADSQTQYQVDAMRALGAYFFGHQHARNRAGFGFIHSDAGDDSRHHFRGGQLWEKSGRNSRHGEQGPPKAWKGGILGEVLADVMVPHPLLEDAIRKFDGFMGRETRGYTFGGGDERYLGQRLINALHLAEWFRYKGEEERTAWWMDTIQDVVDRSFAACRPQDGHHWMQPAGYHACRPWMHPKILYGLESWRRRFGVGEAWKDEVREMAEHTIRATVQLHPDDPYFVRLGDWYDLGNGQVRWKSHQHPWAEWAWKILEDRGLPEDLVELRERYSVAVWGHAGTTWSTRHRIEEDAYDGAADVADTSRPPVKVAAYSDAEASATSKMVHSRCFALLGFGGTS